MSQVKYDEDYEYAQTRLGGTIVRLGKSAFYVQKVCIETGNVSGYFTLTQKRENPHLSDLDLRPVPLGYINTGFGQMGFACRVPSRHYKQGLTAHNFYCHLAGIDYGGESVARTIENKFFTPKLAAENVLENVCSSAAFSYDFGFEKVGGEELKVMFRGCPVGKATWNFGGKNLNYHLQDDYQFLQEFLEESARA